jgi:hypothetical protein
MTSRGLPLRIAGAVCLLAGALITAPVFGQTADDIPTDDIPASDIPAGAPIAMTDPAMLDREIAARIAAALAQPAAAARSAALSAAVAAFDAVAADVDSVAAYESTLLRLAGALNDVRRDLAGDAAIRNLGEVQALSLRLPAAIQRVRATFDIARVEIARQAPDDAIRILESIRADFMALSPGERDQAIVELVDLLAGTNAAGRDKARVWLVEIAAADLRRRAITRWAEARLAAGEVDPEVAAAAAAPDAAVTLLDLSESLTLRRKFQDATLAALNATAADDAPRDEALSLIVEDMIAADAEPPAILAVDGIAAPALRDRDLLRLITFNLGRRRLDGARRLAAEVTDDELAAHAWAEIGLWALEEKYVQEARNAADLALARADGAVLRDATRQKLGNLLAGLDDYTAALAFAGADAPASVAAQIRLAIVERQVKTKSWAAARDMLASMTAGTERDLAFAALVEGEAKRRNWPNALSALESIEAPVVRLRGIATLLREYRPDGKTEPQPVPVGALIDQATQLGDGVKVGEGRSSANGLLAVVQALRGDFNAARRLLLRATDAPEFSWALNNVAAALVRAGGADQAVAATRIATGPTDRARALRAIIRAIAELGDIRRATELAVAIKDDAQRVQALRSAAETGAEQLDRYNLLNPAKNKAAEAPAEADTAALSRPLLSGGTFDVVTVPNAAIGESLPPLPRLDFTAEEIGAAVPSAAPGRLHVMPVQYSAYNKKFLLVLAGAIWSSGGKLFHIDAQRTAFPVFIFLESGVWNMPAIARSLELGGHGQYVKRDGRDYLLRLPVLIGPDATMVVAGSDVESLRLNQQTGTYIVNGGKLYVYDTELVGWNETTNAPAELDYATSGRFRPFLMAWSGSETYIGGSTIRALGYAGPKGYGLSLSSGPVDLVKSRSYVLAEPTARIVENSFDKLFYGFYSYEAADVALVGNEYRDNVIYGIDPHDRTNRLLVAFNTTYGTLKKHGIIGSRGVNDSWFVGNLTFDNRGSGIMLDRFSSNNLVYANHAFDNDQDGLTFLESPCNIAAANVVFGNDRRGVKIRNSWDVGLFHNEINSNAGIGVEGYVAEIVALPGHPQRDLHRDPYVMFTNAIVANNRFSANTGYAISMNGAASISTRANRFVGQKKLFGGELSGLQGPLLSWQEGGVALQSTCAQPIENYVCPFAVNGYLSGNGLYAPSAGEPKACAKAFRISDVDETPEEESIAPDVDTNMLGAQ